jgi:hypothetical protein
MRGSVFAAEEVLVAAGFDAARRRLGRLSGDGVLLGAAEYAYRAGITGLAAEAGRSVRMPRLAGVQAGDLTGTPNCARLGLRWEAAGPDGVVFPALDANLTLTPVGEAATVLGLAGVYRLTGQVEAGLDPAIVGRFAAVTLCGFLARLACALMHPAGAALR